MALKLARIQDLQEALQRLHDAGVIKAGVEVTGNHDAATVAAIKEFQKLQGLPQDGQAKIRTRTRLKQALRKLAKNLPLPSPDAEPAAADQDVPVRGRIANAAQRRRRRQARNAADGDAAPPAADADAAPRAGRDRRGRRGRREADKAEAAGDAVEKISRRRRGQPQADAADGAVANVARGRRGRGQQKAEAAGDAVEKLARRRPRRLPRLTDAGAAAAPGIAPRRRRRQDDAPAEADAPRRDDGDADGRRAERPAERSRRPVGGSRRAARPGARQGGEKTRGWSSKARVTNRMSKAKRDGFQKKPTLVKLHPALGDAHELVRSARNLPKEFEAETAKIEILEGAWMFFEFPRTDPRFPGLSFGPFEAGVHEAGPETFPEMVFGSAHNAGEGKTWFRRSGIELIPPSTDEKPEATRQVFASQETLEGLVAGELAKIVIHEGEWILYQFPRQHFEFPGEVYGPFGPGSYSVDDGSFGAEIGSLQEVHKDDGSDDEQAAEDIPWHLTFRPATMYFGKTRVDLDSSVEDLALLGLEGAIAKLVVREGDWTFYQFPKGEDSFPGQVYGPFSPGTHRNVGPVRACQKAGAGRSWLEDKKPGAKDPAQDALKTEEQRKAKNALRDMLGKPGTRLSFNRVKPFFKGLTSNRIEAKRVGKTHKGKADLAVKEAFFGLAGRWIDNASGVNYTYIRFKDLEKLEDTKRLKTDKIFHDPTFKQLGHDPKRLRLGDSICLFVKTRGPLKSIHLLNKVLGEKKKIPLELQLTRLKIGDETWTGGPDSPYLGNYSFKSIEGGDLFGEPKRELDRHDYWAVEWTLTDDPDRQRIVNALIKELKGQGSDRQPPAERRIPAENFGPAPGVGDPEVAPAQDAPQAEKEAAQQSAQDAGVPIADLEVRAPAYLQFRWHANNGGLSQRTEKQIAKIAALLGEEPGYRYTLKPVNSEQPAEQLKALLVRKGLPADRLELLPRAERPGIARFELRRQGHERTEDRRLRQLQKLQEGLNRLVELGILQKGCRPTGAMDSATEAAVTGFQELFGLKPDGKPGPRTRRRLALILELTKDRDAVEPEPEQDAADDQPAAKDDGPAGGAKGKAAIDGFVPFEVEKPEPKKVDGPKAYAYAQALAGEALRERASEWARFAVGSVAAWRLGRELPDFSRFIGERLQARVDGPKREYIGGAEGCRHGEGPHDRYTGFEAQTEAVSRKFGRVCRFCGAVEKVPPVSCLFCGQPVFVPRGKESPPRFRAGMCGCGMGRKGLADLLASTLALKELDDERPARLGPLWRTMLAYAALLAPFGSAGEVLPADLRPTRALLAKIAGGANLERALAKRHQTGEVEVLGPDGKTAVPREIYLNASPFAPDLHLERKYLLGRRGRNAAAAVWSWAKRLGSWDKPAPEDPFQGRLTRAEILRLGFLCQLFDAPLSTPEALATQTKKSPPDAPGGFGWLEREDIELEFEVAIVQTDTGEHWPDPEQLGAAKPVKLVRGEMDEVLAAASALQLAQADGYTGALLRNNLGERFVKLPAAYVYRDQWRARLDRLQKLPLVKEEWVQPELFDAQVPKVVDAHERAAQAVEKLLEQTIYYGPGYAQHRDGSWSFPPQRFRHGPQQKDMQAPCLTDLTLMHYFLTYTFSKEKEYSPYLGPGDDLPQRVAGRPKMSRVQLLLGKRFGFAPYLEEVFESARHETILEHRGKLGGWAVALEMFGRRRRLHVLTHFNGQLYRLSAFGGQTRRKGNDDKPLYYGGKVRFIPFETDMSRFGIPKKEARYRVFALAEKYLQRVPENQTLGNSDIAFLYSATTPGLQESDPSQPPRDPYEVGRGRSTKPFHGLVDDKYQLVPVSVGPWQRLARGLLGLLHCSVQSLHDLHGKERLELRKGKIELEGRKTFVLVEYDTLADVEDTAGCLLSRLSSVLAPFKPHEVCVVLKGGSYHQRYLGWSAQELSEFFYQGQAPAPRTWFYRHRKKPPVDGLLRFVEKQMGEKVLFFEFDRRQYKHGPKFRAHGRRKITVQPLRFGPPSRADFKASAQVVSYTDDIPIERYAFRLLPGSKEAPGLTAGQVPSKATDLEYVGQRWLTGPKGELEFRDLPPDIYIFSYEFLKLKDPRETYALMPRAAWEHGPHADDWTAPLESVDEDKAFRDEREADTDVVAPRPRQHYGGRLEWVKEGKPVQFKQVRLLDKDGKALQPKLLEGGLTELAWGKEAWKLDDTGDAVFVNLPEGSYSLELDLANEVAREHARIAKEVQEARKEADTAEAALRKVETAEKQQLIQGKELLKRGEDPQQFFERAAVLRKELPALQKTYNNALTRLDKAEAEAKQNGVDPDDYEALQARAASAEPMLLTFGLKPAQEEWMPIDGVLAGHVGEPLVRLVPLASPAGTGQARAAVSIKERKGYVERTTITEDGSKVWEQWAPDGTHTTEITKTNGFTARMVERPDGSSSSELKEPDGTRAIETHEADGTGKLVVFEPNGTEITTTDGGQTEEVKREGVAENERGALTKVTTLPDGSVVTETAHPNGMLVTDIAASDGRQIRMLQRPGQEPEIRVTETDGRLFIETGKGQLRTLEVVHPDGKRVKVSRSAKSARKEETFWPNGVRQVRTISEAPSLEIISKTELPHGVTVLERLLEDGSKRQEIHGPGKRKHVTEIAADGSMVTKGMEEDGSSFEERVDADGNRTLRVEGETGATFEQLADGTVRTATPLPDGSKVVETADPEGNYSVELELSKKHEKAPSAPDRALSVQKVGFTQGKDGSSTATFQHPNELTASEKVSGTRRRFELRRRDNSGFVRETDSRGVRRVTTRLPDGSELTEFVGDDGRYTTEFKRGDLALSLAEGRDGRGDIDAKENGRHVIGWVKGTRGELRVSTLSPPEDGDDSLMHLEIVDGQVREAAPA